MSDDTTQPIPAEEPTAVQPRRPAPGLAETATRPVVGTGDAGAPTTPLPPVHAAPEPVHTAPEAPAAATGHIRVTEAAPLTDQRAAAQPERTGLRIVTVVWGLVVTAVGVGLLSIAWGAHLDTQLALIVLLGAAGVALLVGSLVGMRRSRTRMEGRG